jgi:hypothetical protein
LHGYISEVSERADVQAGGYPVVVAGGKFGSASALRTFDCVAITSLVRHIAVP